MRLRKIAVTVPVIGLAALMVMGNTKCSTGTTSSGTSTGLSAGGGTVALPRVLLRTQGQTGTLHWLTNLALAAGAADAGAWKLRTIRAAAPNAVNENYGVGDPCFDSSRHVPRKPATKVAEFVSLKVNYRLPFLDCAGLYKAISEHGLPARMKNIVNCFAYIMASARGVVRGSTTTFSYKGGTVAVDNSTGRVTGGSPTSGDSWGQCARRAA